MLRELGKGLLFLVGLLLGFSAVLLAFDWIARRVGIETFAWWGVGIAAVTVLGGFAVEAVIVIRRKRKEKED